jgi:TolB-like protein
MLAISASAQTVEEGIGELAEQIVARSADAGKSSIAISSFPHLDDSCSELSNFLADELVLSLFNVPESSLSIVERSQLEQIFAEIELSMSGAVDANTTQRLGRVHGVEALLVGSIATIADNLRVNARLIDTETAQVFSAAAVNIPRTATIKELMQRSASNRCTTLAAVGGSSEDSASASLPKFRGEADMSQLVGNWIGMKRCEESTEARSMVIFSPTAIGAQFDYEHDGSPDPSPSVTGTVNLDLSRSDDGFFIILAFDDSDLPLQLISPGVLYGEKSGSNGACTFQFARQEG